MDSGQLLVLLLLLPALPLLPLPAIVPPSRWRWQPWYEQQTLARAALGAVAVCWLGMLQGITLRLILYGRSASDAIPGWFPTLGIPPIEWLAFLFAYAGVSILILTSSRAEWRTRPGGISVAQRCGGIVLVGVLGTAVWRFWELFTYLGSMLPDYTTDPSANPSPPPLLFTVTASLVATGSVTLFLTALQQLWEHLMTVGSIPPRRDPQAALTAGNAPG